MKKRVVIFSLVYYPRFVGGAEVAIKELTDRLGDEYEFDMVTLRKHAPVFERIGKVNVHRVGWEWPAGRTSSSKIVPLAKILFPILAAKKAAALHRKRPYDIAWGMMAAYAGFAALFFKLLHPRVPFLLTLQEGDPIPYIKRRAAPVYPLFQLIFRKADRIQTISNYLSDFARSMGYLGAIDMIPNGVDIAEFSRQFPQEEFDELSRALDRREGEIFLITTSRLVTKNACDDVIRALPLVSANITFLILGTGPDEAMLRALAKDLGVEDRVRFLGFVSHDEMPKYLRISSIFIRPSRSEGMGNSFIEALAAGLPVIATQEGGIADFLYDAKRNPDKEATGWAVDKDSPAQIARAVEEILAYPDEAARVTAAARRLVAERYDWNHIASDMRRVFEKVSTPSTTGRNKNHSSLTTK